METINLKQVAADLPEAWGSSVLARIGSAKLRMISMDQLPSSEATHDYDEAFLVLEGQMYLLVAGKVVMVRPRELFVVEAHTPYYVLPNSRGTLMLMDR